MDKTTKRRDDVKILLAYFAGYMVGMTALSYVLERFAAISSTSVLGLIINAVASVLLLGYIVMKKRAELAAAWRTARQAPGKNSWFVVKYFLFAYLATMPVALLLAALQVTNQNQTALVGLFGGALWYAVFMAVVFGPIVEEVVFRGVIFARLLQKSRVLAYAASMLLFALVHVAPYMLTGGIKNGLAILSYLPLAFFLCRAYEQKKSLYASIGVHLLQNSLATILLVLATRG